MPQMRAKEVLDAELKTRVPKALRVAFERIAESRHLKVADVLREACREFVSKFQRRKTI